MTTSLDAVGVNGCKATTEVLSPASSPAMPKEKKRMSVEIGDVLCFSTELLKQIHEQPHHWSECVKLVGVRIEEDGSKTLLLNRLDEAIAENHTVNRPWPVQKEKA